MLKRLIQSISKDELIEWSGSFLAIVGAMLIAANIHMEVAAFVIYLGSNLLLSIFSWRKRHYGILIMTLIFVIINLIGIIRWF